MTETMTLSQAVEAFDDIRNPLKLHPDQRDVWRSFGQTAASFELAANFVREAATEDGRRHDVGAGALDKLAVVADRMSGHLAIVKTEQRGGRVVPASEPMPLRRSAFRQLAARANAPADYLGRIPARLALACLQHGLVTSGEDRDGLLRFAGNEVRAVVSARYAPIDDTRIMETLDAALKRLGLRDEVRVRSVATGPTTLLRLTFPGRAKAVKVGDVIEYGLDIGNGELGNRAVQIDPSTFRLLCLNGMRGFARGTSRRLRHIGSPERLAEAFNDAIPVALADAAGQVDMMAVSAERMIRDIPAEFSLLTSSFGLTQTEQREVTRTVMAERKVALPEHPAAWLDVLRAQRDLAVYDVLNGITAYAQTAGSTDRRLELEEAATAYLARRAA
jgi:hypothetical protein